MMRKLTLALIFVAVVAALSLGLSGSLPNVTNKAYAAPACGDTTDAPGGVAAECTGPKDGPCGSGTFLGFPTWYKYLESDNYFDEATGQSTCQPILNGLNDIWRIGAAIIEIMLRVASLAAIGYVVYGGITYSLSQGSPDKTKQALKTIISALVGLAITIVATAVVTFIAGRF